MRAKVRLLSFALLVCLAAGTTARSGLGEPSKAALVGSVTTYTDESDRIIGVEVVTDDQEVYNVVLNAKGLELGKKMDGKKVEIKGTEEQKNHESWLTVESFREVEAK